MPQIIEQGDIFGRIGKAFGEGAAGQIERGQLASKLRGVKGFPSEGADILSAPGGRETLPVVLPYIQSQREKEAVRAGMGQEVGQPISQSQQGIPAQSNTAQQGFKNVPPKYDRTSANYLVPTDPITLNQRAADVSDQSGIPYADVRARLEREDKSRVEAETNFETRQNLAASEVQKVLQQKLQKDGKESYSDVLGDLQNTFENKAKQDVADGKLSPAQAGQVYGEKALEFAKSRQNLKNMGGLLSKIAHPFSGKENLKNMKSIREKYKEEEQLESFRDDLIAFQGLTDPYANYIAYPPSDNKVINNELAKLKPAFSISKIAGREAGLSGRQIFPDKNENQIADSISEKISPSDSLLSIALAVQGKGYDAKKFMDAMRAKDQEGKLSLNARQRREFEVPINQNPSLGDKYLYALTGLDKLVEIQ